MKCCRIAAWLSCVIVVTAFSTNAAASVVDFDYTGAQQSFVVPVDVYTITIRAWGAQGQTNAGGYSGGIPGGLGGFSTGDLAVVPGETLYIYVGGGGNMSVSGGFNGGGDAGTGGTVAGARGGGGGGASDVRLGGFALVDRIIVAGGGGGAGGDRIQFQGRGSGGGGGGGYYGGGGGAGWSYLSTDLPTGGTQSGGGQGGTSSFIGITGNYGTDGELGVGGDGGAEIASMQADSAAAAAGGMGGGLTGENGDVIIALLAVANWTGQSGAGGSSYIDGLANASTTTGVRSGNGFVQLEFSTAAVPEPASCFTLAGLLFCSGAAGLWRRKRAKCGHG